MAAGNVGAPSRRRHPEERGGLRVAQLLGHALHYTAPCCAQISSPERPRVITEGIHHHEPVTQQPPIIPGSTPLTLSSVMPASQPPKRPRRWLIPTLVAVIALGLIAGGAYYLRLRPESAPAAETSTPAPAATSTAPTATVGQYAGLVNASMTDIRSTWADYDRGCWLRPTKPAACPIRVLTLGVSAQGLTFKLRGAAKPGVPAYIGAPPAEIERLVADTDAAAQKLSDVAQGTQPVDETLLYNAVMDLLRVFDRWAPYI